MQPKERLDRGGGDGQGEAEAEQGRQLESLPAGGTWVQELSLQAGKGGLDPLFFIGPGPFPDHRWVFKGTGFPLVDIPLQLRLTSLEMV